MSACIAAIHITKSLIRGRHPHWRELELCLELLMSFVMFYLLLMFLYPLCIPQNLNSPWLTLLAILKVCQWGCSLRCDANVGSAGWFSFINHWSRHSNTLSLSSSLIPAFLPHRNNLHVPERYILGQDGHGTAYPPETVHESGKVACLGGNERDAADCQPHYTRCPSCFSPLVL